MKGNLKSARSAKIGKVFKVARKELGLSKAEVSNSAFMNIRYINAIESGDYSIFPSEVFARAYFFKYQDFLSIECEFPPLYENNRQYKIVNKSIAEINPSLIPILKAAGAIAVIIFVAVYLFIIFSKETKSNDPSSFRETLSNNELSKIDEADDLNNLIEIPANIIEEKPLINSNKIVFSFVDECWIEIYSNDELIINKLFKYGDSFEVEIKRPFKIVVGNAEAVEATYNGNNIDFITNANRLSVGTITFNNE
jgi:transcriptional regulator with XRE-family HTH domain